MMLIRTYRVRGHLAADLDPLGLTKRERPGRPHARISRLHRTRTSTGRSGSAARSASSRRRCARSSRSCSANYCGHVGLEYMHINDVEERRFLQDRIEGEDETIQLHARRQAVDPDQGHPRASSGRNSSPANMSAPSASGSTAARAMIPALEAVIKYGGQMGVARSTSAWPTAAASTSSPTSWASRLPAIFHEFAGGATNPEDVGGSGDVKYHLGTSSDREFDGNKVHLLAAAQPVAPRGGRSRSCSARRARCRRSAATRRASTVLPILLHGDAAFAGQGIVWECLELLRPARLRHRRHHPLHHQQPGRLHDQPAVRALVALSVGRRQGHPGADPPRQRRRSGSGDLLPASWRSSSARRSTATSSSTCGATAASATTRATSRASPSR